MYPTPMHEWFEEVWNRGNEAVIDRLLAPDAIFHNFDQAGSEATGNASFMERFRRFRSAFHDLHVTVHDVFEQGGYIAGRWTLTGTNSGEGLGFPPTHLKVEVPGMSFGRFQNGRAVEIWDSWDAEGMMLQLGQRSSRAVAASD